jgi:hypothetical protein
VSLPQRAGGLLSELIHKYSAVQAALVSPIWGV